MYKKLKQIKDTQFYSLLSKKVPAFSFLAALQLSSCTIVRHQRLSSNSPVLGNYINVVDPASPELKALQRSTADIVLREFHKSDAKLNERYAEDVREDFCKLIQKCSLKKVQALLEDPARRQFITSKEVLGALRLALTHRDTLSFRYQYQKIVKLLLKQYTPSLEDLCSYDDKTGNTLLHLVIERGDMDALSFLVEQLPLEALCAVNKNKFKTPMHLAARCKSKKMFKILFDRILSFYSNNVKTLHRNDLIHKLFQSDKNGYSVIESSYSPKHKDFAGLLNNSHIQLPTFYRKGSQMFKFTLSILSDFVSLDHLVAIAIDIENMADGYIIYKGYAATLRSILIGYIKDKYGCDADKVIRYVAYRRNLDYFDDKHFNDLKKAQPYGKKSKKLVDYIEKKYGTKTGDEGYVSA